jgi:hypothetical protein
VAQEARVWCLARMRSPAWVHAEQQSVCSLSTKGERLCTRMGETPSAQRLCAVAPSAVWLCWRGPEECQPAPPCARTAERVLATAATKPQRQCAGSVRVVNMAAPFGGGPAACGRPTMCSAKAATVLAATVWHGSHAGRHVSPRLPSWCSDSLAAHPAACRGACWLQRTREQQGHAPQVARPTLWGDAAPPRQPGCQSRRAGSAQERRPPSR